MKIAKVYNNNVVAVLDGDSEVILVGRGLGYQKRRGDEIDEAAVQKRFELAGTAAGAGARGILVDLPYEVITLTAAIAEHLARTCAIALPAAVEIGLADHLATAISRQQQGIPLYNNLLWETKATYPSEFATALGVLDLVRERTGHVLPLDEAGFVAMHLVKAGLTADMAETLLLARALRDVLAIVSGELGVAVREDSPHYVRFLTHLKFVLQRITARSQLSGQHTAMFEAQRRSDEWAYRCARRIADYMAERFEVDLSEEEQLYLMIHLIRLRAEEGAG